MNRLKIAKSKLAIAYFGTPYFSARFLEKLLTDISIKHLIEIKLVVTQADKSVGRKQILTKTPVKIIAEKFGIEVYDENSKLKTPASPVGRQNSKLQFKIQNFDLALLYAYGQIIPKGLLEIPKLGFLNIHPSLLPKYRGALPITMPLILGDKITGVTLIKLDEKVDHGPIIAQKKLALDHNDKKPNLEIKLTNLAFDLFKSVILNSFQDLDSGQARMMLKPQNHSQATYTRQLQKDDGFIPLSILKKALKNEPLNFEELPSIIQEYSSKYKLPILQRPSGIGNSSQVIYNLFRGLYPWPGLWTLVNIRGNPLTIRGNLTLPMHKRLKITDLDLVDGKLTIRKVQLEGKKEVGFKTFNSAYSVF